MWPQCPQEGSGAATSFTQHVTGELEKLLVTVPRLCQRCQRAGGQTAGTLLLHQLVFTLLRFRELSGYDHKTQIDHEERADLTNERERTRVDEEKINAWTTIIETFRIYCTLV